MPDASASVRPFYADWSQYRSRLVDAVRDLTPEQLAFRASPDHDPIWALAAHCAGTRVYWLCGILGEPGADTTPLSGAVTGFGWEDEPDHPRSAAELVLALESTDTIVDHCLDTWSVEMLAVEFERGSGESRRMHSRRSVVLRLMTHDAYHSGEISQLLGTHGLPAVDLWARPIG